MNRMTAEEVAAWMSGKACIWQDANLIDAAQIVRENLVPQWQDEPIEGPCWVRGVDAVCSVYHWRDDGTSEMKWESLNGRKVCPIGALPQ